MGHYKYKSDMISEEVFIDYFKRINKILYDLKIKYWLSFGTLLGYIREGKHIIGDSDIDFGTDTKGFDILEQHKHLFYEQGFAITENKFRNRGKWRGLFIYDPKIKNFHIDISEWKLDEETSRYTFRWHLRLNLPAKIFDFAYKIIAKIMIKLNDINNIQNTDFNRYKKPFILKIISNICFEIDWFFNTKRQLEVYIPYVIPVEYYDVKTYIPAYPYTYTKTNYGKNFMIPDNKFCAKGGSECIKGKTKDGFERCYLDE